MARFFKQEPKKPLTYSSIMERKATPNYSLWIAGVMILITIFLLTYFLIK